MPDLNFKVGPARRAIRPMMLQSEFALNSTSCANNQQHGFSNQSAEITAPSSLTHVNCSEPEAAGGYSRMTFESALLLLNQHEALINADSLKDVHRADSSGSFCRSVLSVYRIVSSKLYRCINLSLEEYFRVRFNISRAQVYRLLDCAQVLIDLQEPLNPAFVLKPYPLRQRVAKTIKDLASTRYHRQLLWSTVLHSTVLSPTRPRGASSVADINSKEVRKAWFLLCKDQPYLYQIAQNNYTQAVAGNKTGIPTAQDLAMTPAARGLLPAVGFNGANDRQPVFKNARYGGTELMPVNHNNAVAQPSTAEKSASSLHSSDALDQQQFASVGARQHASLNSSALHGETQEACNSNADLDSPHPASFEGLSAIEQLRHFASGLPEPKSKSQFQECGKSSLDLPQENSVAKEHGLYRASQDSACRLPVQNYSSNGVHPSTPENASPSEAYCVYQNTKYRGASNPKEKEFGVAFAANALAGPEGKPDEQGKPVARQATWPTRNRAEFQRCRNLTNSDAGNAYHVRNNSGPHQMHPPPCCRGPAPAGKCSRFRPAQNVIPDVCNLRPLRQQQQQFHQDEATLEQDDEKEPGARARHHSTGSIQPYRCQRHQLCCNHYYRRHHIHHHHNPSHRCKYHSKMCDQGSTNSEPAFAQQHPENQCNGSFNSTGPYDHAARTAKQDHHSFVSKLEAQQKHRGFTVVSTGERFPNLSSNPSSECNQEYRNCQKATDSVFQSSEDGCAGAYFPSGDMHRHPRECESDPGFTSANNNPIASAISQASYEGKVKSVNSTPSENAYSLPPLRQIDSNAPFATSGATHKKGLENTQKLPSIIILMQLANSNMP